MHKKGQLGLSFGEWIVLILSVIVVLAIAGPLGKILGITGGREIQESEDSFFSLAAEIDRLVTDPTPYLATRNFAYKIGEDYVIVGFPHASRRHSKIFTECEGHIIDKPTQHCGNQACLCLYEYDEYGEPIVPCETFDADDIFALDYWDKTKGNKRGANKEVYANFMGQAYPNNFLRDYGKGKVYTAEYADLVIYGECDRWWYDEEFSLKKLLIEKYYDLATQKTAIFIAVDGTQFDDRVKKYEAEVGATLTAIQNLLDGKRYVRAAQQAQEFAASKKIEQPLLAAEAYYLAGKGYKGIILTQSSLELYAEQKGKKVEEIKPVVQAQIIINYANYLQLQPAPAEKKRQKIIQDVLNTKLTEVSAQISSGILPTIANFLIAAKPTYRIANYLLEYESLFAQEIGPAQLDDFLNSLRKPMHDYVGSAEKTDLNRKQGLFLLANSYENRAKQTEISRYGKVVEVYGMVWEDYKDTSAEAKIRELCVRYAEVTAVDTACNALKAKGFVVSPQAEPEGEEGTPEAQADAAPPEEGQGQA